MKQKTLNIVNRVRDYWQQYWLLRWVLANMLGWASGLFGATLIIWFLGGIGALFSGAILGLGMSAPQAWILFSDDEMPVRRKWMLYSASAGFLAIFPALILSIIGLFNLWLAALLVGLVFGGLLGLMQSFVLVPLLGERAYLWIPMCIAAAAIASLLSIPILLTPIPLVCSPASIVFALMTGWLMLRWMMES